ncbi:pseudouridine synthase [Extensimonas perlucida]|uniref:pseudouridine synthase n=1 Tax=Extensimonas perlucida TaxID=2590786 RepID=UPI0011AAB1CF|nr:pseudouridine synthase [Extensimonas perlucida]
MNDSTLDLQSAAADTAPAAKPARQRPARPQKAAPESAAAPVLPADEPTPQAPLPGQAAVGGEGAQAPTSSAHRAAPRARSQGARGKKQPPAAAHGTQGYQFADVVSGRFDADEASEAPAVHKRVLLPQAETPKLHKVLAQAGLGSRLEMEQLILEGRISVNNEPAHIGQRIQYGDQVKVNGKPLRVRIAPPPTRVIAYHKPVGEVVTHDDPQNRPTVFRKLPRLVQGKWQSVGRLDLNTEGLLLFTNSGALANQLMHPRFGLEREYAVRVLGALSEEEKQRLLEGVRLEDGMASFRSIEEGGGEGANCWYRVTIAEGRNREVRRIFEAVGHAVSRLIRIRYGAMVLPRGLRRGAWLELDSHEVRALMQAAGVDVDEGQGRGADAGRQRGTKQGGAPVGKGGPLRSPPSRRGKADGQGSRANAQPDPMKTSVGYIGRDSLSRQRQTQRRSGGGRYGGGR